MCAAVSVDVLFRNTQASSSARTSNQSLAPGLRGLKPKTYSLDDRLPTVRILPVLSQP